MGLIQDGETRGREESSDYKEFINKNQLKKPATVTVKKRKGVNLAPDELGRYPPTSM